MSNIQSVIEEKNKLGHRAFIPFITAGDPNLEKTEAFIYALEEVGSTVIEIGIPFSDPVADGPVIQKANQRAIATGVDVEKVFKMVESVRRKTQIPLVFLMYANTIYHYGIVSFFKRCQNVGVDGIIVPDVPLEEKEEFNQEAKKRGVDFIALVTPTSQHRISAICKDATGFLYCVSSLGVTGVREKMHKGLKEMFEEIEKFKHIPTALGFGISTPEQAKELKAYADGIIVGSAIVKIIEEHGEESEEYLKEFARQMVEVL